MTALAWLIPCALLLGVLGLAAFLWSLNSGQFEDLEGAGWRALQDDEPEPRASLTSRVATFAARSDRTGTGRE
jgi:cbb3-type cytochrome oxidase maturation protein